jgi:CheY-like chemotaxis protein/anti-sigma regulatory factor (Ser/Thr protein kinase)
MAELVRASVEEALPSAERKRVELALRETDGPIVVRGDAARLSQAVGNLLSNAVKFTPSGGRVDVTTERTQGQVTITVSDTGEGISSEFLPHVFERFRQADDSTTRHHGGLGLGLTIARHLAERHGGTLEGTSPGRGQGATFLLSLPLVADGGTLEQPIRPAQDELTPLDVSVILVDDDADTGEAIAVVLREHGAQVRIARSVDEALAIDTATHNDVVVSDISMPGSDGYALIRKVRDRDADRGSHTVAIAMTGLAGRYDRDKALAAGFDEHVAKPIEPVALVATIRELVRPRS